MHGLRRPLAPHLQHSQVSTQGASLLFQLLIIWTLWVKVDKDSMRDFLFLVFLNLRGKGKKKSLLTQSIFHPNQNAKCVTLPLLSYLKAPNFAYPLRIITLHLEGNVFKQPRNSLWILNLVTKTMTALPNEELENSKECIFILNTITKWENVACF